MADPKKTESRVVARGPNHLAIVIWIAIGPVNVLLGADLEETTSEGTGWSVIVSSKNRPPGRASIFKVAHHGSQNGHNADVWQQMLANEPFAILTPYTRGSRLPQQADRDRLTGLTSNAYTTATFASARTNLNKYPSPVQRSLREGGLTITAAEPRVGHVQLRNGGLSDFERWSAVLSGPARKLEDWKD